MSRYTRVKGGGKVEMLRPGNPALEDDPVATAAPDWAAVKKAIADAVYSNTTQDITGDKLQAVLLRVVAACELLLDKAAAESEYRKASDSPRTYYSLGELSVDDSQFAGKSEEECAGIISEAMPTHTELRLGYILSPNLVSQFLRGERYGTLVARRFDTSGQTTFLWMTTYTGPPHLRAAMIGAYEQTQRFEWQVLAVQP